MWNCRECSSLQPITLRVGKHVCIYANNFNNVYTFYHGNMSVSKYVVKNVIKLNYGRNLKYKCVTQFHN